ncbi:hypothetical protein LWI28_014008 [Acer negundo]|uniref:Uncharacterized protein n=1 Tax=Acer negundo TaxID=4023 RepID=A0AAD5IJB1_ACENE|nr:hypothetical protein LWI28_014008 [Acer negundo]
MLWIDKETKPQQRMNVGRMLVLTPVKEFLTREVVVKVGGRSFPVKFIEQMTQISVGWLSNHLKVKLYYSNLNYCSKKDDFGLFSLKTGREAFSVKESRSYRCRVGIEKDVSVLNRDMKKSRKVVKEQVLKNLRQKGDVANRSGIGKEKGKSVWIPSQRSIAWAPLCKGNEDQSRIGGCQARNERIQSGKLKSLAVKKPRGKYNSSSVKIHPMITRGLKGNIDKGFKSKTRRVTWNLEEEITKVIEKRTAIGLYSDDVVLYSDDVVPKAVNGGLLESKMGKEITVGGNSWNTEEEVAKVVQTGAALGLDYNGLENEIVEYLSLKETEEEGREDK